MKNCIWQRQLKFGNAVLCFAQFTSVTKWTEMPHNKMHSHFKLIIRSENKTRKSYQHFVFADSFLNVLDARLFA